MDGKPSAIDLCTYVCVCLMCVLSCAEMDRKPEFKQSALKFITTKAEINPNYIYRFTPYRVVSTLRLVGNKNQCCIGK